MKLFPALFWIHYVGCIARAKKNSHKLNTILDWYEIWNIPNCLITLFIILSLSTSTNFWSTVKSIMNLEVGVIGAGIIGLSTATRIQKSFPNADITLIAENFNEETTSDGGIFRPGASFSICSDETTRLVHSAAHVNLLFAFFVGKSFKILMRSMNCCGDRCLRK